MNPIRLQRQMEQLVKELSELARGACLALEVASIRNAQERGALWGTDSAFQEQIDALLEKAGRGPQPEDPSRPAVDFDDWWKNGGTLEIGKDEE